MSLLLQNTVKTMHAISCQMSVLDQNIMCNQFTQVLFALGDDVSSTTLKFIFPAVPLLYSACTGSDKTVA